MYNTAQSNNFQMQKRTLHHGMHKANVCVTSASVAGRGGVEMCFCAVGDCILSWPKKIYSARLVLQDSS